MKILYFGKICDEEIFETKIKKQQPFFIAQYMFEKALIDQLKFENDIHIDIISIFQTEYYPEDTFIFKKKKSNSMGIKYLSFINVPYLREISYFISAFWNIINWFFINKKEKKCIYSSCHFPPVSLAVVLASKIFSINKVITFTDLSLFTYSKNRIKKMRFYKRMFIKPYVWLVNKLQESYDMYILFSEDMKDIVNPHNKPFLVMEGMFNSDNINLNHPIHKSNAIAHAGTLNKEVGIDKILKVFNLIGDSSIELWLIGKGDMVEDIIESSKIDKRIKYLGFMPREKVFERLKEAKLLINLRNPEDDYTKYSFPSKMFEYMVSGTPVLTTKIKGIPEEYFNFLYTVNSYDSEVIKRRIEDILNKEENITGFGLEARKFIIQEKNSAVQTKRIVEFLDLFR